MGMTGAILGGTLLGLGASSMKQTSRPYSYAGDVHSSMAAARPETPEPPATPGADNGQASALMEADREKERQQAAMRQRLAREVFTGGLGAAGIAGTAKKTLLGG
ncbi:MAG: hypothetical protein LBS30_05670 [Planctomycetota bacterium]|jgi:hypothetical protein|nr:hypothetical protein [Planctomycetota bacterium]